MRLSLLPALALACLASTVSGQSAGGKRSSSEKFFVAFSLNGSAIKSDELNDKTQSGGGVALGFGYGFTRRFALFVEGAGASIDRDQGDYLLSHVDIGARFTFANADKAFVPFVEAALTGRAATQENAIVEDENGTARTGDLEVSGAGFSLGGGFHYFFKPKWAVTTGIKWTAGEFNTVRVGSVSVSGLEIDATTTRVNVGISWFPRD